MTFSPLRRRKKPGTDRQFRCEPLPAMSYIHCEIGVSLRFFRTCYSRGFHPQTQSTNSCGERVVRASPSFLFKKPTSTVVGFQVKSFHTENFSHTIHFWLTPKKNAVADSVPSHHHWPMLKIAVLLMLRPYSPPKRGHLKATQKQRFGTGPLRRKGPAIIRNEVDFSGFWSQIVDRTQELQPFLMTVPVVAHADHSTVQSVQCRK